MQAWPLARSERRESARSENSIGSTLSGCWVCAVVDGHEVGERDLRVFLGGGEAGVAQQFLDGAEVGAVGQQVRRVGVAEAVRVKRRIAGKKAGVEFHDA